MKKVDTYFLSHQSDWGKFEQENTSIALNVLFVPDNSEEIKLAYKSNNNKRKNQVVLLIISNEAINYYFCQFFTAKRNLEGG